MKVTPGHILDFRLNVSNIKIQVLITASSMSQATTKTNDMKPRAISEYMYS
jgi:hypothetical protein